MCVICNIWTFISCTWFTPDMWLCTWVSQCNIIFVRVMQWTALTTVLYKEKLWIRCSGLWIHIWFLLPGYDNFLKRYFHTFNMYAVCLQKFTVCFGIVSFKIGMWRATYLKAVNWYMSWPAKHVKSIQTIGTWRYNTGSRLHCDDSIAVWMMAGDDIHFFKAADLIKVKMPK